MMAVTVTLDLFGEQRTVELRNLNGEPAGHVAFIDGFVGTIGRGVARYETSLALWRIDEDKGPNRGNYVVTATDGTRWQFHLSTAIRNRQAQIVGWADTSGVTNDHDQRRR